MGHPDGHVQLKWARDFTKAITAVEVIPLNPVQPQKKGDRKP